MPDNTSAARTPSYSTPTKLSEKNLSALSSDIRTPQYNRAELDAGILHMSVGGFHRSHQAVYIDDVLSQSPANWMIAGVGLMPQDLSNLDKLREQDCLYSVLERSPTADNVRVVGSMKKLFHAPSETAAVIAQIASAAIKIVSLTVTEKGYYYNEKRDLDFTNATIQDDLKLTTTPKTMYGYLTQGLQKRRADGAGAVTIMCCDNLPGNGHITQHLLNQFVEKADPSLIAWIAANVSFPNAMVDRITPVTTPAIQQILEDDFALADGWPVVCEDYIQWILEDKFIAGRPDFEKAGVQMVADVEPYEKMKVRLLNGSHSALSYISYLMGHRTVDKAMADPLVSGFVKRYMDEDINPTVPNVPGIDLTAYRAKLIERFANPSISDQVQRLAEDGSQKIRNAMVPPLMIQSKDGKSIRWIALALAGWWRYLQGVDEAGEVIQIKDPIADRFSAAAKKSPDDPRALLAFEDIFGAEPQHNKELVDLMTGYLSDFKKSGVKATVQKLLNA